MLRIAGAIAAVTAAALVVGATAYAKGPSRATVTGPGLARAIVLGGSGEDGYSPLGRLTMESGFFPGAFGENPNPMLTRRPRETLGPRYTVTYVLPGGSRPGDRIRQYIYPYAPRGPVTYTPAGQRFWGTAQTFGGWYRASAALMRTLVKAGLPAAAPAVATDRAASRRLWPFVLGGLAAAALVAAGLLAIRRRPHPAATP